MGRWDVGVVGGMKDGMEEMGFRCERSFTMSREKIRYTRRVEFLISDQSSHWRVVTGFADG